MKVIYRITCTANQKFYIGSTVNKNQRWARHRKDLRLGTHPNKNLQASWSKYGEAAFVFEVLEVLQGADELFAAEQKYLDAHAGKDYCFNWALYAGAPLRGKTGPGTPNYGRVFGPEMRARLSAAVSGENHPNWGKSLSPETKEKIRAANVAYPHKNRRHTPEAIAKIAAASKGRVVSEETRAKRSAKLKGREIPLEQRLRISQTLSGPGNFWFGKKRSEEFKEKVRKPIVAINPDGVDTRYASIQDALAALNLKPPTVHRALKAGTPLVRGPYKGWSFRYDVT